MNSLTRNTRGFTLIEALASVAIVSLISLGMTATYVVFIDQASARAAASESGRDAAVVLQQIEEAIRLSTSIDKAGDGVLELSTVMFVDGDTGTEVVRYELRGRQLTRCTGNSSLSLGSPKVLLEDVSEFQASYLCIQDSFDSDNYGGGVTTGDVRTSDPATQTKYLLTDLGDVDGDLASAWSDVYEDIEVTTGVVRKVLTVAPSLAREGLSLAVDFIPLKGSATYAPIGYGSGNLMDSGVSVVFAADGTIVLERTDLGLVVESAGNDVSWNSDVTYRVGVDFVGAIAYAWVESAGVRQDIGSVSHGNLDAQEVHMQVESLGASATFDNLEITYPIVHVTLGYGDDGRVLHGGAAPR